MLISLYKHFHTQIEPPGFAGRSKLKQEGRKNTMLCSVRGMEKPYWTVITKTQHRTVHTGSNKNIASTV